MDRLNDAHPPSSRPAVEIPIRISGGSLVTHGDIGSFAMIRRNRV